MDRIIFWMELLMMKAQSTAYVFGNRSFIQSARLAFDIYKDLTLLSLKQKRQRRSWRCLFCSQIVNWLICQIVRGSVPV